MQPEEAIHLSRYVSIVYDYQARTGPGGWEKGGAGDDGRGTDREKRDEITGKGEPVRAESMTN